MFSKSDWQVFFDGVLVGGAAGIFVTISARLLHKIFQQDLEIKELSSRLEEQSADVASTPN